MEHGGERRICHPARPKDGSPSTHASTKTVALCADCPQDLSAGFEQAKAGEERQFRIILSPEDAGEPDMTDFVRLCNMQQVERDLNRRLKWVAVNHYNTEHPHAYRDQGCGQGRRDVRLDRGTSHTECVSAHRSWSRSSLDLGIERSVRLQHHREVEQSRFTELDREIGICSYSGWPTSASCSRS
jgi:type IV secretory pathway VirD2 relaxase